MRLTKAILFLGFAASLLLLMVGFKVFQPAQSPTLLQPQADSQILPPPNHRLVSQESQAQTLGQPQNSAENADPQNSAAFQTQATPTATLPPAPQPLAEPTFVPAYDADIVTCAEIWGVPEIPFLLPKVLTFPTSADELYTEINYYFLAAMLIQNKAVDASDCPFGGLETFSTANVCGLEKARPVIVEWQNQYNAKIFEAGQNVGIPAFLLKNLFARESQFWPGYFVDILESGFGQLNDTGVDALFMYNRRFFDQFCPLVLSQSACNFGYTGMDEANRRMLRGALVRQVNASCASCPVGINQERALNSIPIFAEVLKSNCSQVGQIVQNVTERKAGDVADYVDLWRLTVANYNAGPGCTYNAIVGAWKERKLDWLTLSEYFDDPACEAAPDYVEEMFRQ